VNVAEDRPSPADEVQRLYNEAETSMARAMEDLVARDSFGVLLVRTTENVMGIVQIATGAIDLLVRNLRIAGRADVTGLARQIGRTEDKLELVLQEVERLGERIDALQPPAPAPAPPRVANGGATARRRKTSA
jgi:hypothetical protein